MAITPSKTVFTKARSRSIFRAVPRLIPSDGEDGLAGTVAVGAVTTLPNGSPATVVNVGTPQDAILNFGIPEGGDGGAGQDGLIVEVVAGSNITVDNTDPTRPVIASTASGSGSVTSVDITLPTGLQVSGNPITTSGTFAVTFASGYSIPTTTKQGQWDTAYGWGNHASAGYLTTVAAAAAYQPLDADLTTLAGLTATTDNFIVSVSSAWASRTPAQVRTTLGLVVGTNVQAYDADLASWAGVTRASGFDTFVVTPSSANLRGLVTDEAGTTGGLVFAGYVTGAAEDFIPAEGFVPPITNGAQAGIRILASNGQALFYYGFDTSTQEILYAKWLPRKRYDGGTITFAPIWTAESGSGTVEFELSAVAASNDDPLDAAFGTAQASADTLTTAGDNHTGPTSSAITIAGTFADGDFVWLKLVRDVANDTLGVDAQFLGLKIFYTTDQANDA